jgi:hypothetical protein
LFGVEVSITDSVSANNKKASNALRASGFLMSLFLRIDEEFTSYTEDEVSLDLGRKLFCLKSRAGGVMSSDREISSRLR